MDDNFIRSRTDILTIFKSINVDRPSFDRIYHFEQQEIDPDFLNHFKSVNIPDLLDAANLLDYIKLFFPGHSSLYRTDIFFESSNIERSNNLNDNVMISLENKKSCHWFLNTSSCTKIINYLYLELFSMFQMIGAIQYNPITDIGLIESVGY